MDRQRGIIRLGSEERRNPFRFRRRRFGGVPVSDAHVTGNYGRRFSVAFTFRITRFDHWNSMRISVGSVRGSNWSAALYRAKETQGQELFRCVTATGGKKTEKSVPTGVSAGTLKIERKNSELVFSFRPDGRRNSGSCIGSEEGLSPVRQRHPYRSILRRKLVPWFNWRISSKLEPG